jgi:hypothetical protein
MKISNKPTSLMLVGFLIICIFLTPALAGQKSTGQEQLNKLREHSQKSSDLGMLKVGADTIYFPWSGRETQSMRPDISGSIAMSLKKEEILMDSSNSTANLRDLMAVNSLKQRDLRYKDSQEGDASHQGLANTQDISISGKEGDKSANEAASRELDNNDLHQAGNYLSIDVHDISVSAINTMKGGSAVATSNIIIEPVQIIVCPSEVKEKLK